MRTIRSRLNFIVFLVFLATIALTQSTFNERAAIKAMVKADTPIDRDLLQRRIDHHELIALLAIATPSIGILWILFVIRYSVFKSLHRLSRRMMDFLVDRYSFQFSAPEENEFGDLQRTFNALAEKVLNNMDDLKSLDRAKSEFLSIASHELRTPMTSIKGSLGLLASGIMGDVEPQFMDLIRIADKETDRLIRLINDLLDLAKIEARKLPLNCQWVLWKDFIAETCQSLSGLASEVGVQISHDSPENIYVFLDQDRTQQILTNLISNAIKFSPEGSSVKISTGRAKDGQFLVNVRDQGPGISLEDQHLIFQKFRQGSTRESGMIKGTGLGLAIAKALIEEHGGNIGVDSQLLQGSIFWFTLPKWEQRKAATEESVAP